MSTWGGSRLIKRFVMSEGFFFSTENDFLPEVDMDVVSIFFFNPDDIVSVFFLSLSITLLKRNLSSCHY